MKTTNKLMLICFLIFVLPNLAFSQQVDNPQEELIKSWYLDKLVIDQQDYFFVSDESVQNVVIDFGYYEASEDEAESGGFRTRFCEDTFALYLVENDQELFTFSWTSLASAEDSLLCGNNPITDDRASDVRYLYDFWQYEDYDPFHYTYSIQQVENDLQKLIVINDNGDEAHFQNVPNMFVEKHQQNNLLVYPNPVKDFIHIENLTEQANLKIYDLLGKQIFQQEIHSSDESLDVFSLSNGLYFYDISQNGKSLKTGKLVKR